MDDAGRPAEVGPAVEPRDATAGPDFLRRLPLFAGLPTADLDRLCRMARRVRVAPGETLMEEGGEGDGLYVVVDGRLEVTKREGDGELVLAVREAGEFLGEMSLLERGPRTATVRAVGAAEVMVIAPEDFHTLIATSPTAAATILRVMAERLRSTEAALMEQEKLASLGTLAAGLAHELNNPAAALRRAVPHLEQAMDELRGAVAELARAEVTAGEADAVAALLDLAGADGAPLGDPLARSLEEERMAAWLDQQGVPGAWDLAPSLVSHGLDTSRVQGLTGGLTPTVLAAALRWTGRVLAARQLLDEIRASAGAVSDIVGAVRDYAYLDRAPIQELDLADSLETTLVILRHRLRDGVKVERDLPADLPRIEGHGSELNQVWTNLIANAIDAMDGRGTLRLSARAEHDHVVVEVTDSGPGVPEHLRSRIFDPFFTTKPPGAGTGLGLHIAHNIVVHRHRGRIGVESRPGRTTFRVRLPLRLEPRPA